MKKDISLELLFPTVTTEPFAEGEVKIEPAFWWCGMKNPELQLLVYGQNIADYRPCVEAPGVYIASVVQLENPNYLLIYLQVEKAEPGMLTITFSRGKKCLVYPYELKARKAGSSERVGFDSSDVLYLLMPDRFAQGRPENGKVEMRCSYEVDRNDPNARHGGDLAGIEQHLDYIAELGVTAIWLNPVLENDMEGGSYHGYAITDFYRVDPRFGTNEEYVQLIEKAHERGIRVVMDMIFNHCGSGHPWMREKPGRDWFNNLGQYVQTNHDKEAYFDPYVSDYDRETLLNGWFVPSMPDLNQKNPHVARYLIQNSIWWIEYADIDGIRQDTYPYADADMMRDWCVEVMHEYPDFNIVGEAWINQTIGSAFWQKGSKLNEGKDTELKSVMDFRLAEIASQAFHEETEWEGGLHTIFEHLCYDFVYPDIYHVLRFFENHDTDRFLADEPSELYAFKLGITFLLTIPGIPQLYYGQELLMHGSKMESDGHVRRDIPGGWPGDKMNWFEASGRSEMQNEAWRFIRTLLHWRKGNEVIAKGKMKHFRVNQGVYVYERSLAGKSVVVFLNGSSREVQLPLDRYAEVLQGKKRGMDILTGELATWDQTLPMMPKGVRVIEL